MLPQHQPYALIARDADTVEIFTGEVVDVDRLSEIPLFNAAGKPQQVLSLVPFSQVTERGYPSHSDDSPLRCLIVHERQVVTRDALINKIPVSPFTLKNAGFDIDDEAYADIVRRVIADEIGAGEGANFVIRRDYCARVSGDDGAAALSWFRALLEHERGAYWTFLISTPGHIAVGASPEAHVTAHDGVVTMNPISGTLKHAQGGLTTDTLTAFLSSTKETEELFMVVDEELKMMAAVCRDGGHVTGPHLKHMSHVTHTEYMLQGHSTMDPRDIIRETMFAPTVTGSPMQNACEVIMRYEHTPRGYYSGVLALFTPTVRPWSVASHDLDAPIMIRTAHLVNGEVRVPVGATLVRHSDPHEEVLETHGKAAGLLSAIGAAPGLGKVATVSVADDDAPANKPQDRMSSTEINDLLASRNSRLSPFWLNTQVARPAGPFSGKTALIIDGEDRFTTMLGHQLSLLGFEVTITPWSESFDLDAPDLVVSGPGPGDPQDQQSARMQRMRSVVYERLQSKKPLLAVCLSHQILSDALDLRLAPLPSPHQGVQLTVDLFGESSIIGFYNTYSAWVRPGLTSFVREGSRIEVAADPHTGAVYSLKGEGFASIQGHLESILSVNGFEALEQLVAHALSSVSTR